MSTLSSVTDGQLCDDADVPGCAPKIVVQQSGAQAVVASNPTNVSAQSSGATIVTSQNSAQVVVGGSQAPQVVVNSQTQRIVTTGQQGIQGVRGNIGPIGPSAAGLIPPIDFAYGDASPATVLTLGVDSEIVAVSLQVEEAFNGTGASVSFGVAGDPESLFPAAFVDLSSTGIFQFSPRVEYAAGTQLLLTITPGSGASQGRGQIIVSAVPTS